MSRDRTYGASASRRIGPPSSGLTSMASTDSWRRPFETTASPDARRLRTQLTSPNGDWTNRRPSTSTTATGKVRGTPEVRPRTVSRTLGPNGMPAPTSRRIRGFTAETSDGAREVPWALMLDMVDAAFLSSRDDRCRLQQEHETQAGSVTGPAPRRAVTNRRPETCP